MKNLKFNFGENVIVKAHLIKTTRIEVAEERNKTIIHHRLMKRIEFKNNVQGIIIGLKRFYLGEIKNESYYCKDYLEISGSELLYEVKTGWLNKVIYVHEQDIIRGSQIYPKLNFPILYKYYPCIMSEKYRKELSDIMKTVPRDSKGRWIKEK